MKCVAKQKGFWAMDDSVYPTTSQRLLGEPKKQEQQRKQAREEYLAEKPLIAATIKHLEARIDFLHDINSITENKDPENFMRQVEVNKLTATALEQELRRLEVMVEANSKK